MWEWNQAEKAVQMGARYAVATELVPSGLATYSYATDGGIPQGDPVPVTQFPGVSCSSASGAVSCSCKAGGTCAFSLSANADAFREIVARINVFKADVGAANVLIDYDYSGLGYAGDPNGPDVAPLVTVRLRNVVFQPVTLMLFNANITLPDFSTTLSLEDGQGTASN
jgi:hypothetical protein